MNRSSLFNNRFFLITVMALFTSTLFNGCYSLHEMESIDDPAVKIYKIETIENNQVSFGGRDNKRGYATIVGDNIISIQRNGEEVAYPLSIVKKMYTDKFDAGNTLVVVVGLPVILFWLTMSSFTLNY